MTKRAKIFLGFFATLELLGFALIAIEIAILLNTDETGLFWIGMIGGVLMAAGGALYAKCFRFFSTI